MRVIMIWGLSTERHAGWRQSGVESRCGAVAVGSSRLFPRLSDSGVSIDEPWLRFHIPLVEPSKRFSRTRLPDKRLMRSPTEGYA